MKTLFQTCIYLTMTMIIFTLSINFVNAAGFYPTTVSSGVATGDNTNDSFTAFTTSPDYLGGIDMTTLWGLVLTAAGAIGLLVAWITRSTTIIGVYIFSVVFWASYINALSIINIGGFLTTLIDYGFLAIGTVAMGFVFVGAIAGMLSGSG